MAGCGGGAGVEAEDIDNFDSIYRCHRLEAWAADR
jgi:hypothetical protein